MSYISVLEAYKKHIEQIKAITREQVELVQSYRNAVLALLLAIYVPLSFASVRLTKRRTD